MQFSHSLKENSVFQRLYRKGATLAGPFVVVYCRRSKLGENRLGITVSKKLGHAVVRNRVRRRLREIYRLHESEFTPGWDIVVVARSRSVDAPYEKLEACFMELAGKLGLLAEET